MGRNAKISEKITISGGLVGKFIETDVIIAVDHCCPVEIT
jgi:hypothetical protein